MYLISDYVFKNSAEDSTKKLVFQKLKSLHNSHFKICCDCEHIFIAPSRGQCKLIFIRFIFSHPKYPADNLLGRFLSKLLDELILYSVTKSCCNIPFPVYFLKSFLHWIPRSLECVCGCGLKCVTKRIFCHSIVDVICCHL